MRLQWHPDDFEPILHPGHRPAIPPMDLCEEPREWSFEIWGRYVSRTRARRIAESEEAQGIDDLQDRKQIAALVGLGPVPKRTADLDELLGVLDSLVAPNEQVDVVQWLRSARKRYG